MMTAVLLTAALATTQEVKVAGLPPLLNHWGLDVPARGEPEYTDDEAAAFGGLLTKLNADLDGKSRGTLADTLAALKMDAKKLRRGAIHFGNATDWVEYRVSPNYVLSAAYTQGAAKEVAFRSASIVKVERAKDK